MKKAWRVAGVAFLAFSIFVVVEALKYGFLDEYGPGAGFFAVLIGLLMGAMSIALVIKVTFAHDPEGNSESIIPRGEEATRVLLVLGGIVGVVLLIQPLGFRLTILTFLTYMLVSLGARNKWIIAAMSIAGSLGTYHVFYHWLRMPLPIGSLLGF